VIHVRGGFVGLRTLHAAYVVVENSLKGAVGLELRNGLVHGRGELRLILGTHMA
jgi:hypothetical protein